MVSYRARLVRLLLRHSIGRRFRAAGASVSELRKLESVLARSQRLPKGTRVSSVAVDGVAAEWVDGPGARTGAAILYLHGGAFVMGSPATHRELAARISTAGEARVLSVAYRLAPEFPFPSAVEDAKAAYRWLGGQGYGSSAVAIGGDSSGGGLALQALLALRKEGAPMPCAGFFMSPVTDWLDFDAESFRTRAELDPLVTPIQTRHTAALYAGDGSGDRALLCPTRASLAGLPPLWIQVGDCEILLSDAQRLAERASEDGVDVEFKVWPGLWHVFQAAARYVPEGRQSFEELSVFLRKRLWPSERSGRTS
jgi:monoterpene epsilon-lactone hydrolase